MSSVVIGRSLSVRDHMLIMVMSFIKVHNESFLQFSFDQCAEEDV